MVNDIDAMDAINSILGEALGVDAVYKDVPIPPTATFFDANKPLILAIVTGNENALGRLIMQYARPYFLRQIQKPGTWRGSDLAAFLGRHGIEG